MLFLEILKVFINPFLEFLKFWYLEIPWHFWNLYISRISYLERSYAVRITLENLFVPLWQDYTLVGRLISFPIRVFKIFVGILVYILFTLISFAIFILIEIFPIILIYLSL
jgi:hypothetical protein